MSGTIMGVYIGLSFGVAIGAAVYHWICEARELRQARRDDRAMGRAG